MSDKLRNKKKMKNNNQLILLIFLLLTSCTSADNKTNEGNPKSKITTSEVEEEFAGPPFKDSCLCNFKNFGHYKINNENYNIYISGKGWNPEFVSCSWIWGELYNNESADDTNVTVTKVHLLDLDNFNIPSNLTEYGNDSIKQYVIAVYTRDAVKEIDHCIFDPYKTGKYPTPKN